MDNVTDNLAPNNGQQLTEQEEKKPSMIESAHSAAEKLKLENERMEKNIRRLEELKAFEALGGRTEGAPQVAKPVEVSPLEYSKQVLAGKLPLKK